MGNLSKADVPAKCLGSFYGVDSADSEALIRDMDSQLLEHLLIKRKDILRQLHELNENMTIRPVDVHPAINKPAAGVTAGPVRKLFSSSISQGEIPRLWRGIAVASIYK